MNLLLSFVAMFAVDFVFAHYTISVQDRRPVAAGIYAAGVLVCNGVVVLNYVQSAWTLIPAAAGAFLGTFFVVARASR